MSRAPRPSPETLREPILAYRAWRIAENLLHSCTSDCAWQPRERMDARCSYGIEHARVPAWDCQCGFYAYKTDAALTRSRYARGRIVIGRVALWGRVVDHDHGYRAEHAYPQVLYLRGNELDDVIRSVGERYAIECVPLPSLRAGKEN